MKRRLYQILFVSGAVAASLMPFSVSAEMEITGRSGAEAMTFFQEPQFAGQKDQYYSLMVEPELFYGLEDGAEIKSKFFYRHDFNAPSRTHMDVRELMYYKYADDWEVHAGIGKVFWGTAESRHLVDVVNQQDWIESLDDESRLGQAMIRGTLIRDWGAVDLFILPGFREVQFMGKESRPRLNPTVDMSKTTYQSSAEDKHIDFAARWSHTLGDMDIGVSYFNGTQRFPILSPNADGHLQAFYPQTQQFGVDAQYILEDWLFKFEGLGRASHNVDHSNHDSFAMVTGVEYTLVGVFDSVYDIGLIGEYMRDDWIAVTPFQNDWMTGLRFVMNDEQSTEVLIGNILDLDDGTQVWRLEASRRVGENWKVEALGRWISNVKGDNPWFQVYKNDDLLSLRAYYYF